MRWPFRRRYDPWPDLMRLQARLVAELDDRVRHREMTARTRTYMVQSLQQTIDDFVLYATVGRDRRKLGPEWVDKAEEMVRAHWAWSWLTR